MYNLQFPSVDLLNHIADDTDICAVFSQHCTTLHALSTSSKKENLKHYQLTISSPSRSKIISLYSCINMHAQYEWDIYIMAFNHVQHLIIRQEGFWLVHNFPHQDSSQRCLILWHIDPALSVSQGSKKFRKRLHWAGFTFTISLFVLYCC